MNELFLQHVWKYQLFNTDNLTTTDGQSVKIEAIGMHNNHAGPDFLHAKIQIDTTLWCGNIEVHIKSSDWKRHNHHTQKEYCNVILHVVHTHDADAIDAQGRKIPTLVIPFSSKTTSAYEELMQKDNEISCKQYLPEIDSFTRSMWIERVAIERLQDKIKPLLHDYSQHASSWELVCYHALMRAFGAPLNSHAFELLAHSLPIKILKKHRHSILQLEAILLGQAGFLHNVYEHEYCLQLQSEYNFYQKKYSLTPIDSSVWKLAKLYPQSFPTIRIAQFCKFISSASSITSRIIESKSIEELLAIFDAELHSFWDTHYTLLQPSVLKKKKLGVQAVHTILINAVVPFLFSYSKVTGFDEYRDFALEILEKLPAEKNSILTQWKKAGVPATNALESQALIQLYKFYCVQKQCLHCQFGHIVLKRSKCEE